MQKHAKHMRSWSSPAVQHFTRVYLHAWTTVDAGDIRTWRIMVILITGKTQRPPIWAPCRNKDGAGSGISRVYLCNRPKLWGFSLFTHKSNPTKSTRAYAYAGAMLIRRTASVAIVCCSALHMLSISIHYVKGLHILCWSTYSTVLISYFLLCIFSRSVQ